MEKDIPCKRKSEETRSNNIHIRQTYFEIRTVTKDKEKYYRIIKGSIQEDYNNCKYLCTQHRSTSIHKANSNNYKRGN